MRLIDSDALMDDLNTSIDEMTKIGIMVDGEWLWAKLDDAIKNTPTIEPERKTGRWIPHDCLGRPSIDKDVCSCCGQRFYQIAETGCEWNYCPNCGSYNGGEKNESN